MNRTPDWLDRELYPFAPHFMETDEGRLGMEDPTFKERHLLGMESVFHNGESLRLEGVGHFPQEEASREVIEAVRGLSARISQEVEDAPRVL